MVRQVLILLGAPGAGKGTQAVRLADALSLPHVSTGDLFRENLSQGTPLGEKAKGYMDTGALVPDELVVDMLFDRVGREDCGGGYLLDGFPRTVAQAEALGSRLAEDDRVRVIDIEVPDSAIVERITGRLSCGSCGAVYHRTFNPPTVEGTCDRCGGDLAQRADDSAEVVEKRLAAYHEQTAPVAGWYRERVGIQTVDGTQSPDDVFAACRACAEEVAS